MARITGKNAKVKVEATRTSVVVAQTMTDLGAHTVYQYQSYWDPTIPPVITKQTHGAGPFNLVDPSLYTVDFLNGKITFGIANNADDVVKVNGIDWLTVADAVDVFDWTIDAKIDTVDATAFQDTYRTRLSSFRGWSGSAQAYHEGTLWFPLFNAAKASYVEFWTDAAGLERYVGAAFVSLAEKAPMGGAVTEAVTFEGTGPLTRLSS